MLNQRRQIGQSGGQIARVETAHPAQLGNVLVEQIHGVFKVKPILAFRVEGKPKFNSKSNEIQ